MMYRIIVAQYSNRRWSNGRRRNMYYRIIIDTTRQAIEAQRDIWNKIFEYLGEGPESKGFNPENYKIIRYAPMSYKRISAEHKRRKITTQLLLEGKSIPAIIKILGCCQTTVYKDLSFLKQQGVRI